MAWRPVLWRLNASAKSGVRTYPGLLADAVDVEGAPALQEHVQLARADLQAQRTTMSSLLQFLTRHNSSPSQMAQFQHPDT